MISVSEAKSAIYQVIKPLAPVVLPLGEAAGLVLAQPVHSPIDLPPFRQSSVDGYAIAYGDYTPGKQYDVVGEVAAGTTGEFGDLRNKAVRIFTGAPLPASADTVVMQEKTEVKGTTVTILDDALLPGAQVRNTGSEIEKDTLALPKNTVLTPAAIGYLAGMGIAQIEVIPLPSVTIIVTGKELQQPGRALLSSQVYEANSFTIKAALHKLHITNITTVVVDDDLGLIQQALQKALEHSEMVLLSGGVSVGDYDFVLRAAANCGVTTVFRKIKQRPGKPLFFGKKDNRYVFGLPGNPASVLTCMYEYVLPAIARLTLQPVALQTTELLLGTSYKKVISLTYFLKGNANFTHARPLGAQESFRLSGFAQANCLIRLEEGKAEYEAGELVEVHLLPE